MKDAKPMLKRLARQQAVGPPADWPARFILSAGAILAFVGANRILAALGSSQMLNVPEPLLYVPLRYVLLLIGAAELCAAWLCLFTKKRGTILRVVACLMADYAIYRVTLWWLGWPHPWGFLGGLTDALHVSSLLADGIMAAILLYLLGGSVALLLLPQEKPSASPAAAGHFKVHCPTCGGKTAFDAPWLGQSIPCPHCGSPLALNKPA